jgi:hypothetical protein
MQYLTGAMDYGWELDQDTDAMINDWAKLRNAWYDLSTVDPQLTQALKNAPQTVIVQWSDKMAGGQTTCDRSTGNYNILLGNDNQKCSTELLAALMSHEAFHVAEYFARGDSVDHNTAANEAFAYSFGYQAASKLGVASDYAGLIPSAFSEFFDIDPYMDKQTLEGKINQARYTLFNEPGSNYYRVIFSMAPYTKWPGIFGTGRSRFLTVAQSVWIH